MAIFWINILLHILLIIRLSTSEDVKPPSEFVKDGSPLEDWVVHECRPMKYGNLSHRVQNAHNWDQNASIPYPITDQKYFHDDLPFGEQAHGRIVWVNNPTRTVSVLEPVEPGGCASRHRATVDVSAKQDDCLIAVNAGFFNTANGECYGNIVSDGRFVQQSGGIQNAHFGIKADGTFVFGYLSEEDVLQKENPFIQLVGGVGWLVRDGEIYVEESRKVECNEAQESGTVDQFFDMVSARVAVGSDSEGRLVIVATEGRSRTRGMSLTSFASWLLAHGVKNAVNLDAGGSTTFVVNGTIANNPSDYCEDPAYRCHREVSSIICIHEPRCDPRDCNDHGNCIQGGCHCDAGYLPPDCSMTCPRGWYGQDCSHHCQCIHSVSCDPVDGQCTCLPGYRGEYCQDACPLGYYGPGCDEKCQCSNGFFPNCHHITGSCLLPRNHSSGNILTVGDCLASRILHDEFDGL